MDSVQQTHQNVVVMRHGDRLDNFEPHWTEHAARPWDPPLVMSGKVRAFSTGKKFTSSLGFPIHRVFVSPFLRCLETAYEVIHALCAVDDCASHMSSADGVSIDPSKLKVSVDYGLCEMLNTQAIRVKNAPKDGDFAFNISECEAVLPQGMVDSNVERVYKKLPKWQESTEEARDRFKNIIKILADKYPTENLLLVTHGEGVGVSVTAYTPDHLPVSEVKYCAYSILIFIKILQLPWLIKNHSSDNVIHPLHLTPSPEFIHAPTSIASFTEWMPEALKVPTAAVAPTNSSLCGRSIYATNQLETTGGGPPPPSSSAPLTECNRYCIWFL